MSSKHTTTEYVSTTLHKENDKNKLLTLLLLLRPERREILLAQKKRGFGVGKWNGYGGKLDAGETIEEATIREMYEESGMKIDPLNIEKRAIIIQQFDDQTLPVLEFHVFVCEKFDGEPIETEEMKPKWFNYDEIPFDSMWKDDLYWYPYFLENKFFHAYFLFHGMEQILNYKITECTKEELGNKQMIINNR